MEYGIKLKRILSLIVSVCMLIGIMPVITFAADTHTIVLNSTENSDGSWSHNAVIDGVSVKEYDYTWHADPSESHDEVKNAPAEYYTGTKPENDSIYISHDIFYYPELPESDFIKVNYDGDNEWAYYYTTEEYKDYIFATLPASRENNNIPSDMMHSEQEAYKNAVLHITAAGTYVLEGNWHGQIWIDTGDTDDTFSNTNAKVTVILNGVDVTCTVAPAFVFYSVYECDNNWENRGNYSAVVDTSAAGANVIIADDTVNNFTGTNVYRMLKTKYKEEENNFGVKTQSKMRKIDGAFYSFVSMNIYGETKGNGVLNINSGFEGLDSELHLTINGGNVNIFSQDDGINVNEDGVSVVAFNGGTVHIIAGLGNEGDGVDSNGFLTVNGGTVISIANPRSDSGLDSDNGSYINGGTVVALGSTMDWAEADDSNDSGQVTMNIQFAGAQNSDEAIIVTDENGKIVFAYDPDKDEVVGTLTRSYRGAIISFPSLELEKNYYVYVGGDVYGNEIAGVYDTATGFSSDAKQQCYTGTWENMGRPERGFPGRDFNKMPRPEFAGNEPPERPDDRLEPPPFDIDGNHGPMHMERLDQMTSESGDVTVEFFMEDMVNNFSGVKDYDGTSNVDNSSDILFTDVTKEDWFYNDIKFVFDENIMTGTSSKTFSPYSAVTRGMIVAVLYRLEGEPTISEKSENHSFYDVKSGSYYKNAITWATENNIVSGYDNGNFGAEDTISYEQMNEIFYNYAKYKGIDLNTNVIDNENISDDKETAIRCQMAVILHQFYEQFIK